MATVIAFHEVDDREHWLASPKRKEVFAKVGITVREFIDPQNPNRVAVLADVPDMSTLEPFMQSQAVIDAMAHDGVRADTLVLFVEP